MSNTLKIVERVRERTSTKTNYATAKALGMNPSNFMLVLEGKRFLGNRAAFKAAAILGLQPADVIVLVEEDKAETAADRDFWGNLCPPAIREKLDVAAALAIVLGFFALTPPQHAVAKSIASVAQQHYYVLYEVKITSTDSAAEHGERSIARR